MIYEFAGMKIKADPSFDYFENKCRSYLSDSEAYDFAVSVTPDALAREREATPGFTDGYYEYVCMYREICRRLPEYGRMLIHSAVIAKGGDGFAFSAKSGVGKTTHILNWKKKKKSRYMSLQRTEYMRTALRGAVRKSSAKMPRCALRLFAL